MNSFISLKEIKLTILCLSYFLGDGKKAVEMFKNFFRALNYRHQELFSNPAEFQRYLSG
jgi:hypothetical protein